MFTTGNCATNFTMPVVPATSNFGNYSVPVMPAVASYGYGGGNAWGNDWISLAIIAMIFGWGGFGRGGFGGVGMGGFPFMMPFTGENLATAGDIQRGFDNQSVINKLNGLENGLCSLGYDQLAQMNGINTNIVGTGYNLERAIQNNAIANMQAQYETMRAIDGNTTANAANTGIITGAIKDCCCDEQMRGMQAEYNAQARTGAIGTQIATATRDLIDNNNAGVRTIYEKLCDMENARKDEKIAALAKENSDLRFLKSQAEQNELLKGWVSDQVQRAIDTIKPQPGPAWIVPNPCGCNNYGYGGLNGFGYYGGTAVA